MGSVLPDTFKIIGSAVTNGFKLDAARPCAQSASTSEVGWSDVFVDEVKRALMACKVFIAYPISPGGSAGDQQLSCSSRYIDAPRYPNDVVGKHNWIVLSSYSMVEDGYLPGLDVRYQIQANYSYFLGFYLLHP